MHIYARLRTRAHKSAAKIRKKNDIRKSACHFLSFFSFFDAKTYNWRRFMPSMQSIQVDRAK